MKESFILLDAVSKSYGGDASKHVVLNDLSLNVCEGEQIAVLGQSGCGKSTLLNLISGIDYADGGQITINQTDLTNLSEQDRTLFRRKHIGFVFQSFNLIQTLTARENIQLPLQLNNHATEEMDDLTHAMLERVGLTKRAEAFPDQLSGGEQQRVAIARAMVHSPAVVLADEHTGNLDAKTGQSIVELFAELANARNQTVLLVTHSRSVADTADRVVYFKQGKLLAESATNDTSLAW